MTWHDMTWHDMTWPDLTWPDPTRPDPTRPDPTQPDPTRHNMTPLDPTVEWNTYQINYVSCSFEGIYSDLVSNILNFCIIYSHNDVIQSKNKIKNIFSTNIEYSDREIRGNGPTCIRNHSVCTMYTYMYVATIFRLLRNICLCLKCLNMLHLQNLGHNCRVPSQSFNLIKEHHSDRPKVFALPFIAPIVFFKYTCRCSAVQSTCKPSWDIFWAIFFLEYLWFCF